LAAEESILTEKKFDAVIVHNSISDLFCPRLNLLTLKKFSGLKILLINSVSNEIETIRSWLDRIHFQLVYGNLAEADFQNQYPSYRFPGTDFLCESHIHDLHEPLCISSIDMEISKRLNYNISIKRLATGFDEFFSEYEEVASQDTSNVKNSSLSFKDFNIVKFNLKVYILKNIFYLARQPSIKNQAYWILGFLPQTLCNKLVAYYLQRSK
jgi:hypothetical protein